MQPISQSIKWIQTEFKQVGKSQEEFRLKQSAKTTFQGNIWTIKKKNCSMGILPAKYSFLLPTELASSAKQSNTMWPTKHHREQKVIRSALAFIQSQHKNREGFLKEFCKGIKALYPREWLLAPIRNTYQTLTSIKHYKEQKWSNLGYSF